ncbi:hypothetical protein Tco_0635223 [Tanacetum coccineum]
MSISKAIPAVASNTFSCSLAKMWLDFNLCEEQWLWEHGPLLEFHLTLKISMRLCFSRLTSWLFQNKFPVSLSELKLDEYARNTLVKEEVDLSTNLSPYLLEILMNKDKDVKDLLVICLALDHIVSSSS